MEQTGQIPAGLASAGAFCFRVVGRLRTLSLLVLCWAVWLGGSGCGTSNVNPPVARANTGYIDIYTVPDLQLAWQVKRWEEQSGKMQTLYLELQPVPGAVLRLASPPGSQRLEVTVINRTTEGPQTITVPVEDGKVTPVRITLTASGSTQVERQQIGLQPSTKGSARGVKVTTEESNRFRADASVESPQAYQPKERMPYWSPAPK